MKPNKGITILTPPSSYNDEVVKSLNEAQAWLRSWYNKRAEQINPDTGAPYLTKAQLEVINYRLDHLKVFIGSQTTPLVLNLLSRKEKPNEMEEAFLHELKSYDHEEQVEAIQDMLANDAERMGGCYLQTDEKWVTLNLECWRQSMTKYGISFLNQLPGDLTRIAIHEMTHACTHDLNLNDDVEPQLNPEREKLLYFDEAHEIYARMNEVRYSLGLEPDQAITKEEIDRFLKEMQKVDKENKEKIEERLKAGGMEGFEVPKLNKRYDAMFLEHFDPDEAERLLNNLAEGRPFDRLNREHHDAMEGSYRPEVAWHREVAPTQKAVTSILQRGFHV